jgi:PAS domain-containing protein
LFKVIYIFFTTPTQIVAPVENASLVLGADLTAVAQRKASILKAYETDRPAASTKLLLRRDGSNSPGVNIYRVLTNATDHMTGLVSYALRVDQLVLTAIPELGDEGIFCAIFDLDAPDVDDGYIVNTQTSINGTIMTAAQNNATLENVLYSVEGVFMFVDRRYRIVLYPSPLFEEKNSPKNLKWFALGGTWVTVAFLLGLVAILFLTLRVHHARKEQKEATIAKLVQVKENQKSLKSLLNRIATQEYTTRATINAIDDIVLVVGGTGKILQSNTAFDRVFKYNVQEMERGVYLKNLFVQLPERFYTSTIGIYIDTVVKFRFGNEEPIEIIVKSLRSEQLETGSELDVDDDEDTKSYVVVGHFKRKMNYDKRRSVALASIEFDRNFRSEKFRSDFLEFSKESKNEENVLFLITIFKYKKLNFHQRLEHSKTICDTYLVEEAPRQLNLSGERREAEMKKIIKNAGDVDAFNVLEEIVKKVLMEEVYWNFMEKRKQTTSAPDLNSSTLSESEMSVIEN